MSSSPAASSLLNDLSGLADDWEATKNVRARLKRIGRIIVEKPEEGHSEKAGDVLLRTMENVKYNFDALIPLLKRLGPSTEKIVEISALMVQIRKFFKSEGLVPTVKVVSDQAWSFRYLLHVAKTVMYRDSPPKESWIRTFFPFCFFVFLCFWVCNCRLRTLSCRSSWLLPG